MEIICESSIGTNCDDTENKNNNGGTIMEIYRKGPIPDTFFGIPFVRLGTGTFANVPDDLGRITLFRDCAAGTRCISELDSKNLVMLKAEVPEEVITNEEHSGEVVRWRLYFWRPWDRNHKDSPEGRRPFEAVTLEEAGLSQDYLHSISETVLGYRDRDDDGLFFL